MVTKVAMVLRDGAGFIADTILKGKGSILKEFQSDTLLAELIKKDMQNYPPVLGNKAQIAICSGVDVFQGFKKREIPSSTVPTPPPAPVLVRQNGFMDFEKNIDCKK